MAWSMLLARLPESSRAAIERASKDGAAASPGRRVRGVQDRRVRGRRRSTPEARDTLLRVVTCPFLVGADTHPARVYGA